ncbi:MAG: alanine:cation symporter family protein, partial [Myxococcota bacterium]|nr:alanine:cation symporter family protein [Myxococcota bacterium]
MNPMLKSTFKYAVPVALVVGLALVAAFSDPADLNDSFAGGVGLMATVTFSSLPGALKGIWDFLNQLPLGILVLVGGAIFFTLRFNFINLLGFWHAIEVTTGKFDNPDDPGEVSHFQALSSALSATVGLGNIAGVAMAVVAGGPGAVFWMMCAALFGMTSKFAECTLGQMYRRTDANGNVQGGPMVYLRDGLQDIGLPNLGKYLSVIFAILCIGGSFGGGNMFQANQSFSAVSDHVPWLAGEHATGKVILTVAEPVTFEKKPFLVRAQRPANPEANIKRTLTYVPVLPEGEETFKLPRANWTQSGSSWTAVVDVRSLQPGRSYLNTEKNSVTTFETAVVEGRNITWSALPGVSVSNPEPISGAGGRKGGLFGIVLAILVGIVIIGGIKSIGKVAEKIVPLMCGMYLLASLWVILANLSMLDDAVGIIVSEAFTPRAGLGGLIGVFIVGVKRAAFSSEAGVGSAAIAHSAAKTDEPIREGIVALLEPFIDTIVVCFMTGMVIVITGVYAAPEYAHLTDVSLTAAAFGKVISWFPL